VQQNQQQNDPEVQYGTHIVHSKCKGVHPAATMPIVSGSIYAVLYSFNYRFLQRSW